MHQLRGLWVKMGKISDITVYLFPGILATLCSCCYLCYLSRLLEEEWYTPICVPYALPALRLKLRTASNIKVGSTVWEVGVRLTVWNFRKHINIFQTNSFYCLFPVSDFSVASGLVLEFAHIHEIKRANLADAVEYNNWFDFGLLNFLSRFAA